VKRLLQALRIISLKIMQKTAPTEVTLPIPQVNQSAGLSQRHLAMHQDGRTLVDDSNISEGNLKTIIEPLVEWSKQAVEPYGGTIQYLKKISLEDLQRKLDDPAYIIGNNTDCVSDLDTTITEGKCKQDIEPPKTNTDPTNINARVSIRPDAGIIMWSYRGTQYPLYIGEDKVQGTNDKLFEAGKSRQATGNAIERYFKNVRAEEMLCAHVPYFPSVVFASGCDFHHTETIAKRLEAGNYATPNHYVEITPETPSTSDTITANMIQMVDQLSIKKKKVGKYAPFAAISSVCIKSHQWNKMPHNSSLWKPHEYLAISKRIVDLSIQEIIAHNKKEN
jgi:hypothetical protein